MKKLIPLVAGVVVLGASLVYWLWSQQGEDAQPGVQVTPQSPGGEVQEDENLEDFGDGLDPEDMNNTFEMSEDGSPFPEDDGQMGQEVDGHGKSQDLGEGGLGGVQGVETIDEDDGETLDPTAPKTKGATPDPQSTQPKVDTDKKTLQ